MNKTVKYILVTFATILSVFLIWYKIDSTPYGGNFTLNNENGKWKFSQNPKKINLLYFGFTKCGLVCPNALANVSNAYGELTDDERKNVRMIFVSVDHKHDKPQDVEKYAKSFHNDFIGVTENKEQIDEAIKLFPAGYLIQKNTNSVMGYSVSHSDKLFFLDKEGKKIAEITEPRNPEKIIAKIRKHL